MFCRVLSIFLSFILLVACGGKPHKDGSKPLVVITSPDNPPFEFKDTARGDNKVIGFDMDVIEKLSEHLGRPIQIIEADFAAIIPSLQSGRADMAIAELAPTEERRKSVDFSDTYYTNKPALLVSENSTLTSEKDLNGQKLGVQLGSSNEALARKWSENISGLSIISLNKVGDLAQELKNGRLQAALVGDTVARKIAASTSGLKVIVLDKPGIGMAIAFPKGSSFVVPVNEALKKMKDDIAQIEEKWIIQ